MSFWQLGSFRQNPGFFDIYQGLFDVLTLNYISLYVCMVLVIFRKKSPICFYSFKLIWSMVFDISHGYFDIFQGLFYIPHFFISRLFSYHNLCVSSCVWLNIRLLNDGYFDISHGFRHILVHFRHNSCHFRQVLCHFRQIGDSIWPLLGNWAFHDLG